jgi:hypothetical protein
VVAVSKSGYGCEYMGWLNLCVDRCVMVSGSVKECEGIIRRSLGQDRGVKEWVGCI